jgi:hypothetical protein
MLVKELREKKTLKSDLKRRITSFQLLSMEVFFSFGKCSGEFSL